MYGNACLYYTEIILTRINGRSPWNSAVFVNNRYVSPEIIKVSAASNAPEIIFYWMAQNIKYS